MIYRCCDERRRNAVRGFTGLNGIDFLEVVDSDATSAAERQRSLRVHFLKSPAPPAIRPVNVEISGGERIRNITADTVSYDGDVLVVHLDRSGDFSTYRLRLVAVDAQGNPLDKPLAGLDVLLAAVNFSFKVECPADFDCEAPPTCREPERAIPEINYLAKDYASFRQLMLDRVAVTMPQWQERHTADLGIALIETLAYVGDYLSYRQDAIATEAYLGTARSRVSVRRHARLVDYRMHEGVSARVWLHVPVTADTALPKGTQAFTRIDGLQNRFTPGSSAHNSALAASTEVFETMHDATLFATHNEIRFYAWGNARCCLPAGATSATLLGAFPKLKIDDVVVFEENTRSNNRPLRRCGSDPSPCSAPQRSKDKRRCAGWPVRDAAEHGFRRCYRDRMGCRGRAAVSAVHFHRSEVRQSGNTGGWHQHRARQYRAGR